MKVSLTTAITQQSKVNLFFNFEKKNYKKSETSVFN